MRTLACFLFLCALLPGQPAEVMIGAQVWTYDRVYPLLDGLFQDAASTQLQQLVLDPNKANGSQLDALVQSFQLQAGYNQLSGVQNSVAAQMALANLGYQSTLAQQQESILQQTIAAQQALTKANQDLAAATQSQDQTRLNAANLEVQSAQALVNGLTAEAAAVKGSGSTWSPSPATGSIAAPAPGTFSSGIPAGIAGTGTAAGGPSYPATKQLDNQMDLLWARLARVMGAMTRPDSIAPDSRMYMIEFDTATFPGKNRKGRLLETRYGLSCGQVVDLFPRVAAVNIANTKYRDNADIIGVMLSWFSFAFNASYNREHLKMSQTLGQSSYITGYGVDEAVFGWKFGIPLGDNFVSADTKRTFALISAPSGCEAPQVSLQGARWEKPDGSDGKVATRASLGADFSKVNDAMKGGPAAAPAGSGAAGDVVNIAFNRVSYDPTKYSPASPVLVAVSVTLRRPVDQEATVYANGTLLKRARDTFGRAIPNGAGSGGLLEESASIAQPNTWMPISPRNLLITLDAGQFGGAFPTIQINNPGQAAPIQISGLLDGGVSALVSGQPFECLTTTTSCQLPSLGYQVAANSTVGVILWQTYCDPDGTKGCVDKLVLQAPSALTQANAAGGTGSQTVQVVTGANGSPWGANPEVFLQVPALNLKEYRLNCGPEGSAVSSGNLVCEFWDGNISKDFDNYTEDEDIRLQVIDQGHTGGALVAAATLPGSAWGRRGKRAPSLWGASNPQWDDDASGGHWEFQLQFVNVDTGSQLSISPSLGGGPLAPTSCTDTHICTWKISVAPAGLTKWFNRMDLTFQGDNDDLWHLLNIRSQISPYVTVMSSDFSSWTGNNFTAVFSSGQDPTGKTGLSIGTTFLAIECPVLTYCALSDPSKLPKDPGLIYLTGLNQKMPLVQLNSDGTTQPITFQPPKNAGGGGGQISTGPAAPTAPGAKAAQDTIVAGGPSK